MSKYIDADLLKKEIERRRDFLYERYIKKGKGCIEESRYDECVEILSFLDTLSEEPDKSLEDAAEISFDEAYALTEDYRDFLAKGLIENKPRPIGPHWFSEYAKKRFIAGAEWGAEHLKK